MSTTTGTNLLPVPQTTDSPDVVRDITALANGVDPLLGPFSCTSTTRPASPVGGKRVIFETDTLRYLIWDGSAWQTLREPIQPNRAFTAASDGAVGNTVYTVHTNSPTLAMVVPPSGKLWVQFGALIGIGGSSATQGSGNVCLQSNGAGLTNVNSSETANVAGFGQSSSSVASMTQVTGMTPAATVTMRLADINATTSNFYNNRWIYAWPVL